MLALTAFAYALPGWIEAGPERGHVIDVAVAAGQVFVATRVGVMRAAPTLDHWERDSRFPVDVQRIVAQSNALRWAVTSSAAWPVTDEVFGTPISLPTGGTVDALATPAGDLLVAIRGGADGQGVWRLREGEAPSLALGGVDPWALAGSGNDVWLGTLGDGLRVSHDGGSTWDVSIPTGEVSALLVDDGEIWAGWSDGRLTRGPSATVACMAGDGPPYAIARVAGAIRFLVDGAFGTRPELDTCADGGAVSRVNLLTPDDEPVTRFPTGLWSLDADHALLGDFRQGPFLVTRDGVSLKRSNFRATITAKGVVDGEGRVILALMGTGTYIGGPEGWGPVSRELGPNRPVSDAVDVVTDGDRLIIADFEGLSIRTGEVWTREPGVALDGAGRQNGLIELAPGPAGALIGRDFNGALWEQHPGGWRTCATGSVVRMAGEADHLILTTAKGFRRLDSCDEPAAEAWPGLVVRGVLGARTDGHWLATPDGLYRDGAPIAAQHFGLVSALAGRGDSVLVATHEKIVYLCTPAGCAAATARLPGPVNTIGWLPNDRIFATEAEGTLLVAEGSSSVSSFHVGGLHTVARGKLGPTIRLMGGPAPGSILNVPPWRQIGRAGGTTGQPPDGEILPSNAVSAASPVSATGAHPQPTAGAVPWLPIVAVGAIGTLLLGLVVFRGRSRPRSRRRRR